jgi:hypothetical protein
MVVALTWLMVPDPSSGMTMMAINEARVRYDSQSLALAGSLLVGMLLSLSGFYLVRGRMRDDVLLGVGAVIGSTAVGDGLFIFARWLSAVTYLLLVSLACLLTFFLLHELRGEGPIQVSIYLVDFGLILAPTVFFVASVAVFCDAWAPLMGKLGDVAYFFVWVIMLGISGPLAAQASSPWSWPLLADVSGVGLGIFGLQRLLHTTTLSLGVANFDATLPAVHLAAGFWSSALVWVRLTAAVIALAPLPFALVLFHRYSPDRVHRIKASTRWKIFSHLTTRGAPLNAMLRPVFVLAGSLHGFLGGVLAELGVTLAATPLASAGVGIALMLEALLPARRLSTALFIVAACWGIIVSEMTVRPFQAQLESITEACKGGPAWRYAQRLLAALALGLVITLPILLRWLASDPLRAAALVSGLMLAVALAGLLGVLTRTARPFIALFLIALYISGQAPRVAQIDIFGANGSATWSTLSAQLLGAVLLVLAGVANGVWRRRRIH